MSYVQRVRSSGAVSLFLAVVFPAAVIAIELASGMCASVLFDPLPSWAHFVLVAGVPAVNLLLWRAVRSEEAPPRWLAVAGAAGVAVSAAYTVLLLPVLPIALVAVIFFGIGLLPFAPLVAGIFALRWTLALAGRGRRAGPCIAAGALAGLAALALADLPATATFVALNRYTGDDAGQRAAVRTMRTLGDRALLLRLAYGDSARATGLASFLVSSWGRGFESAASTDTASARELYYRVTGKPFNAEPPPVARPGSREWRFAWDADQGGTSVGGRVDGLALASSRIDGSTADADNLGYFEWTIEVANANPVQNEARFTLALPEGGVAGRGAARAAYARVVTVERRDPLLVTTDGAQRLLVQAFPIPAGGTIKLRIGFTAPFAIARDGARSLALPAIVERNFAVPSELRHAVWIEGDGALAGGPLLQRGEGGTLRGAPTDSELVARRPRIAAPALTAPTVRTGTVAAAGKAPPLGVTQTIARANATPAPLTILLDGSASSAASAAALAETLDALPAGLPVGLRIAADVPVTVPAAPWSAAQRARVAEALAGARFAGGQDNIGELADALATGGGGNLLWIHGPQPVTFARSAARLEQLLERGRTLPQLVRYQPEPGRAFALEGARWFETAREVTPSGDLRTDLRAILTGLAPGTRWSVTRAEVPARGPEASAHLVRLWAAARLAEAPGLRGKPRDEAIALAHRLNLVTPLSGAVVLETDRDYDANGLPVPSAEQVPTVPEPHEWALLALLAAMLAWRFRHRLRWPTLRRVAA